MVLDHGGFYGCVCFIQVFTISAPSFAWVCLVCRPHKRLSVTLSENGGLREIRNTFHWGQMARTLACIEQKHLGILFLG